jgi:hypothetical protein
VISHTMKRYLAKLADHLNVVIAPDHPLLFNGPDVLLSLPGSVVGLFVASKHEISNPVGLLVRLALTRYAYPQNLRCALILDAQEKLAETDVIRNFHDVFKKATTTRELVSFVKHETANPSRVHKIPPPLRDAFRSRYLSAEHISRKNFIRFNVGHQKTDRIRSKDRNGIRDGTPLTLLPWLESSRKSYSTAVFLEPQTASLVSTVSSDSRRKYIAGVRKAVDHSIRGRFIMDYGVPYPSSVSAPMFLVLSDYQPFTWDPLKVLRATAFVGWALLADGSQNNLSQESILYSHLQGQIERRVELLTSDGPTDDDGDEGE